MNVRQLRVDIARTRSGNRTLAAENAIPENAYRSAIIVVPCSRSRSIALLFCNRRVALSIGGLRGERQQWRMIRQSRSQAGRLPAANIPLTHTPNDWH